MFSVLSKYLLQLCKIYFPFLVFCCKRSECLIFSMYHYLNLHNRYHRPSLEPLSEFQYLLSHIFISLVLNWRSLKKEKSCIINICSVKVEWSKIVSPAISGFVFMRRNNISNNEINKNAEICSSWWAPQPSRNLKSTLNKEIGLQFFMNLLSLTFFFFQLT